jgi:hypothetical protein
MKGLGTMLAGPEGINAEKNAYFAGKCDLPPLFFLIDIDCIGC